MIPSNSPSTLEDAREFERGVAAERVRVVNWLEWHARANHAASSRSGPVASPATTIDLRARANSCSMHALWIGLGKHEQGKPEEPESYTDALTRIMEENGRLRDQLDALKTHPKGSEHAG